jgi:1-aminocyclopropane-1-carboxylate deaminase/D-cysteine desulfhydrase-like pyridoxal-dependent ACC family enzyme
VGDVAIRHLSVKRDDLSSTAYGGNKARKLDFFLGKAIAERRRAVITFGAYGSNHALATAIHGKAVGLEPHAILSPQSPTAYARATLLAHAGLGTHLHPIEGWDGSAACDRLVRELSSRDGVEPLVVPMGGSSALGAAAFANAAVELLDQREPDLVYAAAGTLGTVVGLAVGFAAARARTRVMAPRVTEATVANDAVAAELARETVSLLSSLDRSFPDLVPSALPLELRHDFFEPGYAIPTPEGEAAVALARDFGVKLETTYTGKAMAALLADAADGRLAETDVVFWNTFSSAPMPTPGRVEALPLALRDYVLECERRFRT